MSDSRLEGDPTLDGSVDEALRELCDGCLADEGIAPSDEARRPLVETLGLLPYGLDEVVPGPEVKARLMAELRRADPAVAPSSAPRARRSSPGGLPLAALLLLAVGTFVLLQSSELHCQRAAIVRFQVELDAVGERLDTLQGERDEARAQLANLSRTGTEVCALKPRHAAAPQDAHGTLYMVPGQGWVLSLEGLTDVAGRTYQLWFLGEGAAHSGGTFVTGDRPYARSDDRMPPPGTRAIAITLEPEGGASAPTGPEILFGVAADMVSFL